MHSMQVHIFALIIDQYHNAIKNIGRMVMMWVSWLPYWISRWRLTLKSMEICFTYTSFCMHFDEPDLFFPTKIIL